MGWREVRIRVGREGGGTDGQTDGEGREIGRNDGGILP